MAIDYNKILGNTFTLWYKDRETLKYLLVYFLVTLAFTLLFLGALAFFFGGAVTTYLSLANNMQGGALVVNEAASGVITSLIATLVSNIIPFILIIVPLFLIFIIAASYIQTLLYCRSLQVLGFKTAPFDLMKLLRLFVLEIWVSVASMISWYNKKFFMAFLGLIVLFFVAAIATIILGPIGAILFILWLLVFLVYFLVVIYNSLRLMFSSLIFLEKDQGIAQTTRDAWTFSEGKVVDILTSWLVVIIVVVIASFVLFIPSSIIQFALGFANPLLGIAFSQLYSMIISPILMAFSVYGIVSIYAELSKTAAPKAKG